MNNDMIILIFVLSFIFTLINGYFVLKILRKINCKQTILEYVDMHFNKNNTPTMGGLMFFLPILLVCLFFCANNSFLLWFSIVCMMAFGIVGFLDDYIKIRYKRNMGLTPIQKLVGQGGLSIIVAIFCYLPNLSLNSFLPFTNDVINLYWFIIPILIFVVLGAVNSVNLIDGLDGLCAKVTCVYLLGFAVLLNMYAQNLYNLGYSIVTYEELINLSYGCFSVAGVLLGFLVFNTHKAKIFMGDVGSLALGGFVACVGVISGLWLYIPLLGILYVLTSLSVIIQVVCFKMTGKRAFLMAPLHHHFERKGVEESRVVSLYTIIEIIVVLICLFFCCNAFY